jgi:glycosyltransferase involved in cell wall biosynthesis
VRARHRIAFLTTEFASEGGRGGGLASYLARMAQALRDAGHEPEVFVLSAQMPGVLDHAGVRVERVRRADRHPAVRAARRLLLALGLARLLPTLHVVAGALALARALEARDAQRPFDAVQSADYLATGLFVARRARRPHLVRCSSASDLWAEVDGDRRLARRLEAWLERVSSRRADVVYAPSRFIAAHLSRRLAREVRVLRPPAFLETKPAPQPPRALPPRFLLHLAKPSRVKGTHLLAAALPEVWAQEPALTLVYASSARAPELDCLDAGGCASASRVVALGPLEKPELYACLARAEALVQPSLADNLPNAVIESLLLGIPVVAFAGASLDELIEPGATGELVPMGDADALAAALLRVWRGQAAARRGFTWGGALAAEMRPDCAVARLLSLAGLRAET